MSLTGKIWTGFLLMVTIILLVRCSPYAGKSLLSFFFDGVPGTDSTAMATLEIDVASMDSASHTMETLDPEGTVVFTHYPYQQRECAVCHDQNSLGTMVEPEPRLCYMCHEDFSTIYNYLHGPVAGGYCSSCHDPHMSESEKLLRFTGQQLCFHCHQSGSVYKNEMHQDLEDMGCTECHNPHGGEDKYIFY